MTGQSDPERLDVRPLCLQFPSFIAEHELDELPGWDRQGNRQSLDHPDVNDFDFASLDLRHPAD
jgi:hypothetical protein